jgi:ATP adenylyltransferase
MSRLGRLWAGWRGAYVSDAAGAPARQDECVFCRITAPGNDEGNFVVWRGTRTAAVLNAYPYTTGHLMVVPLRHVGALEDLDVDEARELWAAVTDAVRALKAAYRPEGINVGLNLGRAAGAGVPGHLHVHALPRWDGDTNFMTSVAETRVLPETLSDSWAKVRDSWPA